MGAPKHVLVTDFDLRPGAGCLALGREAFRQGLQGQIADAVDRAAVVPVHVPRDAEDDIVGSFDNLTGLRGVPQRRRRRTVVEIVVPIHRALVQWHMGEDDSRQCRVRQVVPQPVEICRRRQQAVAERSGKVVLPEHQVPALHVEAVAGEAAAVDRFVFCDGQVMQVVIAQQVRPRRVDHRESRFNVPHQTQVRIVVGVGNSVAQIDDEVEAAFRNARAERLEHRQCEFAQFCETRRTVMDVGDDREPQRFRHPV